VLYKVILTLVPAVFYATIYAENRELGVELLKLVPGTDAAVARLCARCAASMSDINRLHQLVRFCTNNNENTYVSISTQDDIYSAIIYRAKPRAGVHFGLLYIITLKSPYYGTKYNKGA